MKNRIIVTFVIGALVVASCTPTATVVDDPQVDIEVSDSEVLVGEDELLETESDSAVDTIESDSVEVSFSQDVWPIIEEYALDAHGGDGGIFLESYADIVEHVEPGNPENSLLYKVLIGDGVPLMPPDNPLPNELIQTIYNWIEQGAKEN